MILKTALSLLLGCMILLGLSFPATALQCYEPVIARLAQGDEIVLRLRGPEYRDLTAARVVHGDRTVRPASHVVAELGPWIDGGRDLTVRANARALTGKFRRIEGLIGSQVTLLVPLRMEITARETSAYLKRPQYRDPRDPASLFTRQRPPRLFSQEVYQMRAYSRRDHDQYPADPFLNQTSAEHRRLIYPPQCSIRGYGGNPNFENVDATLVLSWTPESPALTGQILEIHSFGLPVPPNDDIAVYLDGAPLTVVEKTSDVVKAELPSTPSRGILKVIRASDNAEAVIEDDYIVNAPPDPAPYDFFKADANGHSLTNAFLLMLASQGAYKDTDDYEEEIRSQFEPWGLEVLEAFDEGGYNIGTTLFTDTQGMVLRNDSTLIISFAGTQKSNALDLITDFTIPMWFPNGWGNGAGVHLGFLRAANAELPTGENIFELIKEHVQDANDSGRKVWITGHSLGGAMAQITAYQLEYVEEIPIQGVVTFGQPRVGNGIFSSNFDATFGSRAQRWVHYNDPIPTLPPHGLTSLSYQHAGQLVNITEDLELDFSGNEMTYGFDVNALFEEHMAYFPRIDEFFKDSAESDVFDAWPEVD